MKDGTALGKQLQEKSKANQGKNAAKRARKKRKGTCHSFAHTGKCKFGDDCRFAHEQHDQQARMKNPPVFRQFRHVAIDGGEQLRSVLAIRAFEREL